MKITRRLATWTAALLLSLASGSAALAGPIGVIDDHNVNGLGDYTLSRVNDPNTTANVSFSDSLGNLRVGYTGTNAVEQVLLLRDDFTLEVGQTLTADVVLPAAPIAGWDRDLGIAVGFSETPSSNGVGQSGDKRTNFVEVSWRSNNQIVSIGKNGAAFFASGQEFAGTPYGGQSFNTTDPLSLYISLLTANKFEVGWIQNNVRHPLTANGTALNYTYTTSPVPGAAVGYYADVRVAIASSPIGLDNLQIIPEPASLVLMGASAMGMLWARRRQK